MGRLPVLLLAATGLLLAQPQPKTIVHSRVGPSQIQLFVSNADGTAEVRVPARGGNSMRLAA